MLAAIVPRDTPWTLKFTAQPEKVEQYRKDFRQLTESLSFGPDGTPTWQLPPAWSEEAGANEFVYRAFKPSADSQVRVTLSQLSFPFDPKELDQKRWQDYVVQNVNRWRGQLQLGDQGWEEMSNQFETHREFIETGDTGILCDVARSFRKRFKEYGRRTDEWWPV